LGASAAFVAAVVYCLASCANSTTTTLYTPFTGLLISAPTLFAGHTCGMGPGQIVAYAAVVSDMRAEGGPQPVGLPTANVYACKDDAEFQNLPGSGFYQVQIYAYTKASLPVDLACAPAACAPPTASADFGTPTWTTTCTGVQEAGDNALVQCLPLHGPVAEADGGSANANGGPPPDAAAETAALDATEASDTGALDTGALDSGALDSGALDSGALDSDTAPLDSGALDAGAPDAEAGALDADTGVPDAGAGAPEADAGALDAAALNDGALNADGGD
jgi:hypothetical protein